MEDQLIQVLTNSQSSAEGPRKQAELDLRRAANTPAYSLLLTNIARHPTVSAHIKQSALNAFRLFIERNWSGVSEYGPCVIVPDSVKEQVRPLILDLALNAPDDQRVVKTAARYAIPCQ